MQGGGGWAAAKGRLAGLDVPPGRIQSCDGLNALSTWCRDPASSPAAFCDLAEALGASSLALDATLGADYVDEIGLEIATRGLRVAALEHPCPRVRARRAPRLATGDREERRAAASLLGATARTAVATGARSWLRVWGLSTSATGWDRTVAAFARRSSTSTTSSSSRPSARASRRWPSTGRGSGSRRPSPPVPSGITLSLVNRARWFEIPDEDELGPLLAEFAGAPLAGWLDPAAGVHQAGRRPRAAARVLARELRQARRRAAWLTDACGLLGGLPWGRGEVNTGAVARDLEADTLRVVHCSPGATTEELASAVRARA